MCSILCYAGKDVTKETMEGYLLKTKMRGPDAQQVVETEFGYLGFARLAIMGLTPDGMITSFYQSLQAMSFLCSFQFAQVIVHYHPHPKRKHEINLSIITILIS